MPAIKPRPSKTPNTAPAIAPALVFFFCDPFEGESVPGLLEGFAFTPRAANSASTDLDEKPELGDLSEAPPLGL